MRLRQATPAVRSTDRLCQQYGVRDVERCTEFGVTEFNPELCNIRQEIVFIEPEIEFIQEEIIDESQLPPSEEPLLDTEDIQGGDL